MMIGYIQDQSVFIGPIQHVVGLVDEQVIIGQLFLEGTHILQVFLLSHDLLLDFLEGLHGVECLDLELDVDATVINGFILIIDMDHFAAYSAAIDCLLTLCPQSLVDVLVAEKGIELADIGAVVILHSEEDPQSLAGKFDVGKHHEEVDGVDGVREGQVVRDAEHPSDVEEEIYDHHDEVGRPGEPLVLPQEAVLLVEADQSEISSDVGIETGEGSNDGTDDPIDQQSCRKVGVVEVGAEDVVEGAHHSDQSQNGPSEYFRSLQLSVTDDAVTKADDDEDESKDEGCYPGVLEAIVSLVVGETACGKCEVGEGLHEAAHDHGYQEDVEVHGAEDAHEYLGEQLHEVPSALVVHDLEGIEQEAEVDQPHEVPQMTNQRRSLDDPHGFEEIDQEEDEVDGREGHCRLQEGLGFRHEGVALEQDQSVVDAEVVEEKEDDADDPVEEDEVAGAPPDLELHQVAVAGLQRGEGKAAEDQDAHQGEEQHCEEDPVDEGVSIGGLFVLVGIDSHFADDESLQPVLVAALRLLGLVELGIDVPQLFLEDLHDLFQLPQAHPMLHSDLLQVLETVLVVFLELGEYGSIGMHQFRQVISLYKQIFIECSDIPLRILWKFAHCRLLFRCQYILDYFLEPSDLLADGIFLEEGELLYECILLEDVLGVVVDDDAFEVGEVMLEDVDEFAEVQLAIRQRTVLLRVRVLQFLPLVEFRSCHALGNHELPRFQELSVLGLELVLHLGHFLDLLLSDLDLLLGEEAAAPCGLDVISHIFPDHQFVIEDCIWILISFFLVGLDNFHIHVETVDEGLKLLDLVEAEVDVAPLLHHLHVGVVGQLVHIII